MDDAQRNLIERYGSAVGIDPSLTGTAVCILLKDMTPIMDVFSTKPAPGLYGRFQRYTDLVDRVSKAIAIARPRIVYIEGYAFGAQGNAGRWSAEYGGLLRDRLLDASIVDGSIAWELQEIPPTTLKKFASGKGNASKAGVMLMLSRKFGVHFSSDDEYDAYALARMAARKIGWDKPEAEQMSLLAK